MTDIAALLRRRSGEKGKKKRECDVKIDGWVSGLFNKATVWSQVQTSNTTTATAPQTDTEPKDHPVCVCEGESRRAERERESFRILQGPTKATLLLHLLYIIWQTSRNTERGEAERKRISPERGRKEESRIARQRENTKWRKERGRKSVI